jgi:hypothetical protein
MCGPVCEFLKLQKVFSLLLMFRYFQGTSRAKIQASILDSLAPGMESVSVNTTCCHTIDLKQAL